MKSAGISNKQTRISIVFIVGTIVSGAIGFLNAPVLTHCLSSETYVEYGMFVSFVSVIVSLSYMGFDNSYMRFYYENTGIKYLFNCLLIPLLFWFLTTLAMLVCRKTVMSNILGSEVSVIECVLLSAYLLVRLVSRFTLLTMRMESKAWNYVLSDCISKVMIIFVILLFRLIVGEAFFGLILFAYIAGGVIQIIINLSSFSKSLRSERSGTIVTPNNELFKYGFFLAITNTIMVCVPFVQKYVARDLFTTSETAVFYAAMIFQTAISLISIGINNIWEPMVYKAINKGDDIRPAFHRYGVIISWLLLCVISFVVMFRRVLVLVLAEQYYEAYIIAPCVTLSACMEILFLYYSKGIEIGKKTWIKTVIPIIDVVLLLAFMYIFGTEDGISGAALAMLIGSCVSKLLGIAIGLRYYNTGGSLCVPIMCFGISLTEAVASLFLENIIFDLLFGGVAILLGCVASRQILVPIIKELMNKRNKTSRNRI